MRDDENSGRLPIGTISDARSSLMPEQIEIESFFEANESGRAPLKPPPADQLQETATRFGNAESVGEVHFPKELSTPDLGVFSDPDLSNGFRRRIQQFRFWHVEPLLNQAADLLDRCIRERTAYFELRAKWMDLKLDMVEFSMLQAVHDDEVAAGWYTLPSEQSLPEERATAVTLRRNQQAASELDQTIAEYADVAAIGNEAGLIAKASSWNTYQRHHTEGLDKGSLKVDANADTETGGAERKVDFLKRLSAAQSARGASATRISAVAQQLLMKGASEASAEQLDGRRFKAEWDLLDIAFRRRRSEAAIYVNELKRSATLPGGPFDYVTQLRQIRDRIRRDWSDAFARLTVARVGLEQLLHISVPGFPAPDRNDSGDAIDTSIHWVRSAIRELQAFSQTDQHYVWTFSVRSRVGESAWRTAIDGSAGGAFGVEFRINATDFPDQRLVRLRGLSASIGSKSSALGKVVVRIPRRAASWDVSVNPSDDEATAIDQSQAPPIRQSRVRAFHDNRAEDVVGASAVLNLSPISDPRFGGEADWRITLEPTDVPDGIDDLWISLYLAVAQAQV